MGMCLRLPEPDRLRSEPQPGQGGSEGVGTVPPPPPKRLSLRTQGPAALLTCSLRPLRLCSCTCVALSLGARSPSWSLSRTPCPLNVCTGLTVCAPPWRAEPLPPLTPPAPLGLATRQLCPGEAPALPPVPGLETGTASQGRSGAMALPVTRVGRLGGLGKRSGSRDGPGAAGEGGQGSPRGKALLSGSPPVSRDEVRKGQHVTPRGAGRGRQVLTRPGPAEEQCSPTPHAHPRPFGGHRGDQPSSRRWRHFPFLSPKAPRSQRMQRK